MNQNLINEPLRIDIDLISYEIKLRILLFWLEINIMTCDVKREKWRQKQTLRQNIFSRLFYVIY